MPRWSAAWQNTHLDLTPYVAVAREYLDDLDEATDWIGPIGRAGRVLSRIPSPALRELPLAAVDTSQRALRRALRIAQVPV